MRTIERSAIVAAALALAGCAQTPPPAIQVKTVQVDVPLPVRCINPAKVPTTPARSKFDGDAVHDVSVLEIEATGLRDALDRALALIRPCVVTPAPTTSTPAQ